MLNDRLAYLDNPFFRSYFENNKYVEKDIKKIADVIREEFLKNRIKVITFEYFPQSGEIRSASRPKATMRNSNGKGFIQMYDLKDDKNFKRDLREYIMSLLDKDFNVIAGEIEFFMEIYRPMPKSFNKTENVLAWMGITKPLKKPDVDNYEKIVYDALNGYLFFDDKQIVKSTVIKKYGQPRIVGEILYKQNPTNKKTLRENHGNKQNRRIRKRN